MSSAVLHPLHRKMFLSAVVLPYPFAETNSFSVHLVALHLSAIACVVGSVYNLTIQSRN